VTLQAVFDVKPMLTIGEAREMFDHVPDCENCVNALRPAGMTINRHPSMSS
jgi:hypothetical protein